MNPALMEYLAQIQQQGQIQDQQMSEGTLAHPFQSGANLAMHAARQSIGMPSRERQNQMARGRAIYESGRAMMQPHESNMGRITNAMSAGLQGAMQQQDLQEAQDMEINSMLYQQMMKQQQLEEERERRIQESEANRELKREMHEQNLEERKRQHDLMQQYHNESLGLQRERGSSRSQVKPESEMLEGIKGLYGVEYTPVNPKDNEWKKIVNKEKTNLIPNKRAIESIKDMKKIFDKYPDIGSSFVNIIEEEQKGGPSWSTVLMRKFTNEDERSAIQLLKKLSADIQLDTVMGLPGQKGTDIMKRAVQAASPTGTLTKKTFDDVSNIWLKRANENINRIKVIEDAQKRGMMPLFTTMEEEGEIPQGSTQNASSSITPEQAREELIRRGIHE